jgi:4-aminobutyrate aminotransferase/(S)-3-amino-2-methylpropionate transaminase
MALTGRAYPYRDGFGPFAPETYMVPYPYPYRFAGSESECAADALAELEEMFRTQVHPSRVAAIIIEPVLGEGGFVVPPSEFLPALHVLCREHGILLIVDEIQTGFGRTGRMFASEYMGIEPDLIVLAKAIASGLPLSAVVGRAEITDSVPNGGVGGTYCGNPVACAAAIAVLDVFEEEHLVQRAQEIGRRVRPTLERFQEEFALVGDVRGIGPMLGMELVKDRTTKEPATQEAANLQRLCLKHGLIILRGGVEDNFIRLHFPLVISDSELDQGLGILEFALREMRQAVAAPAAGP